MFIFKENGNYEDQFKTLYAGAKGVSRKKMRHSCYIKNEVTNWFETLFGDLEVWLTVSNLTKDKISCVLYITQEGGKEPILNFALKRNTIVLEFLKDIVTSSSAARILIRELFAIKLQKCFDDILTSSEIVKKLNSVQGDRLYKEVFFSTNFFPFANSNSKIPDLSIDIDYVWNNGKKDIEESVFMHIDSQGSFRNGFHVVYFEDVQAGVFQDILLTPFGADVLK